MSQEDAINNPYEEYFAHGASHTTLAISFQSICKELGIVPRAWDLSSIVVQTMSRHWSIAHMAYVYYDQEKKRFKIFPRLKCNAIKWFVKLQEKHYLKKYTHVQKRRTRGKITFQHTTISLKILASSWLPKLCNISSFTEG